MVSDLVLIIIKSESWFCSETKLNPGLGFCFDFGAYLVPDLVPFHIYYFVHTGSCLTFGPHGLFNDAMLGAEFRNELVFLHIGLGYSG